MFLIASSFCFKDDAQFNPLAYDIIVDSFNVQAFADDSLTVDLAQMIDHFVLDLVQKLWEKEKIMVINIS